MSRIRNFVIIAHVDHGKSTLADRLLEFTGTIEKRNLQPQYLDRLESERERGITIKMAPVRMIFHPRQSNPELTTLDLKPYTLNLIDTPGHNDFAYEVSRSLAAVEGAILLVDVSQGIQAQTLANYEAAKRSGLKIIGVVTKIDLNPTDLDSTINTLAQLIGVAPEEIIKVSGKTGAGVTELLDAIIDKVPPPRQTIAPKGVSRALIFDSLYDEHKGVIAFVRVFNGSFNVAQTVKLLVAQTNAKTKEVGTFAPQLKPTAQINEGEIGYLATGLKDPDAIKIGDTVLALETPLSGAEIEKLALSGYNEPQPVVFVSFYPEDSDDHDLLKQAFAKLRLNDASLTFEPDKSELLGRGFKCGFLGQLHFEITVERLEKEFKISTVHSFPSVAYRVRLKNDFIEINNPKDFPEDYLESQEPMTQLEIMAPAAYLGGILSLQQSFRLSSVTTENLDQLVIVKAKLPLADLIGDFDDQLKSATQGYASLSYKISGFETSSLEKMEILIAGHIVPGLTRILPKEKVEYEARRTVQKLKDLLPRQQFIQAIQASARHRVIARETIPALKKDVTGYLYGGDRSRKMKLWKKQQRGKERLKERAGQEKISLPPSIFRELLKK